MNPRPGLPGPMKRRGPRPLLLHLMLARARAMSAKSAHFGEGSPNLNVNWAELLQAVPGFDAAQPEASPQAVPRTSEWAAAASAMAEAAARDAGLIAGIAAYRRATYVRPAEEPAALWQDGESRVLDYNPGGAGPAILFVPSLINRGYILDLMPGASMLRWLAAEGFRPLLLDWGWPGPQERGFDLTAYITGRLAAAVAAVPGPVIVAGYCMGGLLALSAALRQPEKITALALLATPWDFHGAEPEASCGVATMLPLLEPMLKISGAVSIDTLQTLFAMVDPFGVIDKYTGFDAQDPDSPRARRFVAMEDWLADGVPLAAPVVREALSGWYGNNTTAKGEWRVAGEVVEPSRLLMPCFAAVPVRDRLVPPQSARPLAALIPNVTVIEPSTGHIGMVAGTHAETALWRPFADWLRRLLAADIISSRRIGKAGGPKKTSSSIGLQAQNSSV